MKSIDRLLFLSRITQKINDKVNHRLIWCGIFSIDLFFQPSLCCHIWLKSTILYLLDYFKYAIVSFCMFHNIFFCSYLYLKQPLQLDKHIHCIRNIFNWNEENNWWNMVCLMRRCHEFYLMQKCRIPSYFNPPSNIMGAWYINGFHTHKSNDLAMIINRMMCDVDLSESSRMLCDLYLCQLLTLCRLKKSLKEPKR